MKERLYEILTAVAVIAHCILALGLFPFWLTWQFFMLIREWSHGRN